MIYFNDLEKQLQDLKSDLLINPEVKSDLSNVLVNVEIRDGKEYLHLTVEKIK